MRRTIVVTAATLLGVFLGASIAYIAFRIGHASPILVYSVAPLLSALIVGRWLAPAHEAIACVVAVTCAETFALFVLLPDPKTDFVGAVEAWAVFGIPVFSLLPVLLGVVAARRRV